jgi:hypothetical protein
MKQRDKSIERRMRISGLLVSTGLIIELVSLLWSHPTAFLSFILLGGVLMATGILFYLYLLVIQSSPTLQDNPQ